MKWIRWDGDCCFDLRDTAPVSSDDDNYKNFIEEDLIDCEKHEDWREIESGVLDTATGKLRITLKPVVQKEPTLREAAAEAVAAIGKVSPADLGTKYSSPIMKRLIEAWWGLKAALDREASTPANPYTKEAVDELLRCVDGYADVTHKHGWRTEEPGKISCWQHSIIYAAEQVKKQREAANGG